VHRVLVALFLVTTVASAQDSTERALDTVRVVKRAAKLIGVAPAGDFSSAGSSEFHLAQRLASPFVSLTSGENGLDFAALQVRRFGSPYSIFSIRSATISTTTTRRASRASRPRV
jgi:hypothetical protein